jgi:predicted RND superfamily exporter protein
MYVVFFGALIGAAWHDLDIDSDFSSFIRADGKNMRQMDAYLEALAERTKKQKSRRLHESTETLQWRRKNLVDLEGEGTGSWRRLRELTLDDVDVTSRDDAEWLMDFQDSGNGRLLTGTVGSGRRAQGVVATMRTLVLTYMPDNKNAFDSRLLKGVRDFEAGLRAMPAFQELCGRAFDALRVLCDPGETFIAYTYPSRSQPAAADKNSTWFSLKFDATGPDMLQIPAALAVLQQSKEEKHDLRRFFPKAYVAPVIGTDVSSATPPVGFRTKYTFLMLVGRRGAAVSDIRAESDKVIALFDTFIKEEAFPYLQSAGIPDARVLYSGDVITSYEVSRTLRLDAQFALGSMTFVTVYMWFHTGSLILAVSCIITIITAVPLAYVLTPSSKTTVASFLSLFLVTGIGCDVVFVYIDCWEQSSSVEKIRERRLAWMMLHAGRNCLATSLTTAASFFANLASALQPLREFGLFMGLSVFGAFLLVAMFLPPLILLRENCCGASQREGSEEEGAMGSMAIVPAEPSRRPSRQISPANVLAQKVSKRRLCMQRVLMWLMGKIAACPKAVALFSCIALAVFLITVAALFEIDNEVPDIFPSDHNQIAEAKAQELFTVQSPLLVVNNPAESGPACLPDAYWDSTSDPLKSTCLLNWCESPVSDGFYSETTTKAPTVNGSSGSSTLTCWWNKATPKCNTVDFRVRVASNSMPTASSFENAMGNHIQTVTKASAVYPSTSFVELSSLVRENWETGGMQTSRFFDAGKLTSTFPQYPVVQVGPPRPDVCTVSLICYQAGVERCDHPGWANTSVKNIQFETSRRMLEELPTDQELLTAPVDSQQLTEGVLGLDDGQESGYSIVSTHLLGRSLSVSTVPVSKRVDITVLWGVRPARSTPLVGAPSDMWSFDPTFEPSNPWAQRAIQAMCDDGNLAKYELLIISKRCFINSFKDHLDLRGKRFPTRDFESDINEWYPTTIFASEDLWRQGTQVQAGKISFILNLAKDIAAQPLLDHQKKWDDYLTAMNSDASVTANRPYHTAAAWVRAEAEIAVVASTVDTIIVSAVCAWLGMALFTQDLTLACLVLVLVLGIVCGLAFFIVVVVGWKFGSIEVISLVIFVGYSVTYSLHIAHSYAEARVPGFEGEDIEAPLAIQDRGGPIDTTSPQERRKQRTIMAIVHIGSAVFSSALSTLGSSIFLLCCTMVIFVKLGSVVIAVTLLSILCALIVLPAFLMILGPPEEAWHKRCLNSLRRTRSRLKGS